MENYVQRLVRCETRRPDLMQLKKMKTNFKNRYADALMEQQDEVMNMLNDT